MNDHEAPLGETIRFVGHVLCATVMFGAVAFAAHMLGKLVHYMEADGASVFILYGLLCAEYLIFAVDLLLMIIFLLNSVISGIRSFIPIVKGLFK